MRLTPDSLAAAAQRAKEREARARRPRGCVCDVMVASTYQDSATGRECCDFCGRPVDEEPAPLAERRRP